ncbi:MAG: hypothetical protein A2836_02065 [Candidatus Taylorbacteria bacterium RIFCSPHIGHO2_01_FULL_45_63]|uniref:dolichyl-phosphate beta-glucosyltransferase n=1 Tax=Candidatus Taylorbacteria bacterium RIFCSPHIGHO2_02_FULL_45_35 TaxID=1802311 RepID=A0A1G2MUI2_9BACT|nr:MAG: hypothetical protein A2836_02065 [Candidatus Taylorbacteria bacterium RIFCSPHIGHO2_01_FULL_45_63]OHA27394.1 MAG: hypothetical protein A3D56_03830 [Candidatus Taylorbacteria bacterium RIFCSPHIGHO2_02_FULL_45_35]OHA34257.1 MAG: hypothetical protein A3A22_01220 [Candidatus Taylorbacteria bacterium RIFCSPLOWO2_01_FULL_45_34b]
MSKQLSLSIIIPVWNEEKRLPRLFSELEKLLASPGQGLLVEEVIFVNDGSTDKSAELIEPFAALRPVRLISYQGNKGKGYAVRVGMEAFQAEYCLIADADVSTPFSEARKFLPDLERGVPVVIGTRKAKGAVVKIHQPFYREKMGQAFTFLARVMTGVSVSDFTCGFKFFRREVARKIAKSSFIDRWSYDAEILFLAKKFGYEIKEIPVSWSNDARTAVRLVKDAGKSLIDLIRTRIKHG